MNILPRIDSRPLYEYGFKTYTLGMNNAASSKVTGYKVVDESGTVWLIKERSEGATVLVRGWGVTTEKKFVLFGGERLRDATPEEWTRYIDSL